ncbi:MAG: LLM class flavin-dependent oxidoreductase, partial [Solirubrobacteraceae bacterium]
MATRGVCVLAGRMVDTIEIAAAADAAGLDAAWTSEFNDRSAIVALAAMAQNTERCRVGSAIAYA